MKLRLYSAIAAAVTLAILALSPSPASAANLTFCNRTSTPVGIAVGYYSSGANSDASPDVLTGPFVSHGWWLVDPGHCDPVDNPFDARYMFWFGISKGLNDNYVNVQAMEASNSERHFCVPWYFGTDGKSTKSFTLEDENRSLEACHAGASRLWVVPQMVDVAVDPTVNYTGP
jgi:Protein of unknown function (DUF1036)